MNVYGFVPDFENLKATLMGGRGHRVPNIEFLVCREIMAEFLGVTELTVADEVEFYYQAGYDYAITSCGLMDVSGVHNQDFVTAEKQQILSQGRRVWAEEHAGVLQTIADIDSYPWPDPETMDYSDFLDKSRYLKPGMKLISVLGKIFTTAWQLFGFEKFSEMLYDNPKLVNELLSRIAEIQIRILKKVVEMDFVGAVCISDDVAYGSGPMMSPKWLKERIFPFYRKMAEICRRARKPIIYHSDGDMTSLLETVLETGFNALHPVEPESMDIYQVRERVGKQLCLLGNIRVHSLATGTQEEIAALVKDRICHLGHDGAYCVGSSNSIPDYVPLENYKTMLETSAQYGKITK
jgi:uroporphyrinogen decarboxylase